MFEDFKFYAVVDGSLYPCSTVEIHKSSGYAYVTVGGGKPFRDHVFNLNSGKIPLVNLRLFDPNTIEIRRVPDVVAHYRAMAIESSVFHANLRLSRSSSMNPQLEAVAMRIFAPDHKHSWCEFDDGVQCLECGEICQHKHVEAVVYETIACNGAFGYYEPPEEATEWHCVECGAIVPPPLKELVTDDDDDGGLPF